MFKTLAQMRDATQRARAATGMPGIGTEVAAGRFRVVLVTYGPKGAASVDPLSDWGTAAAALETLGDIERDKAFRTAPAN